MNCPRCHTILQNGTYESVRVFRCEACSGILLKQPHITTVLVRLARDAYESVSADFNYPIVQDHSELLTCPECKLPMERHGYMGSSQLLMDSCSTCRWVWLDAEELATMVSMYVRFDKNMENFRKSYHPADIVTAHMILQAVAAAFLTGFVLG